MQRQRQPSQEQKQPISQNSNSPEAHPCKDVELFSASMQRQKQPANSCNPSAHPTAHQPQTVATCQRIHANT